MTTPCCSVVSTYIPVVFLTTELSIPLETLVSQDYWDTWWMRFNHAPAAAVLRSQSLVPRDYSSCRSVYHVRLLVYIPHCKWTFNSHSRLGKSQHMQRGVACELHSDSAWENSCMPADTTCYTKRHNTKSAWLLGTPQDTTLSGCYGREASAIQLYLLRTRYSRS